jgi:hypothetical protein
VKSRSQITTHDAEVNCTLLSVVRVGRRGSGGFVPKVLHLGPGEGNFLVVFTAVFDSWMAINLKASG